MQDIHRNASIQALTTVISDALPKNLQNSLSALISLIEARGTSALHRKVNDISQRAAEQIEFEQSEAFKAELDNTELQWSNQDKDRQIKALTTFLNIQSVVMQMATKTLHKQREQLEAMKNANPVNSAPARVAAARVSPENFLVFWLARNPIQDPGQVGCALCQTYKVNEYQEDAMSISDMSYIQGRLVDNQQSTLSEAIKRLQKITGCSVEEAMATFTMTLPFADWSKIGVDNFFRRNSEAASQQEAVPTA